MIHTMMSTMMLALTLTLLPAQPVGAMSAMAAGILEEQCAGFQHQPAWCGNPEGACGQIECDPHGDPTVYERETVNERERV